MVIFLKRGSEAKRFLREEFIDVSKELAYIRVFKLMLGPPRYYNCQGIRHKAFSYREAQRCGYCAQEGYSINNYSSKLKCVICLDSYSVISRACPVLHRL